MLSYYLAVLSVRQMALRDERVWLAGSKSTKNLTPMLLGACHAFPGSDVEHTIRDRSIIIGKLPRRWTDHTTTEHTGIGDPMDSSGGGHQMGE